MFSLGLLLIAQSTATLTLDLSKPGVAVSPNLYGLMTEEINHSYDGGLYAELVSNRAFKDHDQRPDHWSAVGEASVISLDHGTGISKALPTSLKVKGSVANDGYWGMPIRPSTTYRLSLWAKADQAGALTVSLDSASGASYARAPIQGVGTDWKKFTAELRTAPDAPSTTDARLMIRTQPGQTVWLGLVSLFPPTYNNRPNGNRLDLMQMLIDMHPTFLRFPGGNYVEGSTFRDRFNWKATLGPLENRTGHRAPWGYRSSDGMGLLEFLEWCEDMHAKPVLALFAGYVLQGDVILPGTELSGFVQDALDEIEYVSGPPTSKWGAVRARDGHAAPFPLDYVEVGNEDAFDQSGSYEGRYVQFYDAIKRRYPKIKVISTTGGKDWGGRRYPITQRKPDLVDEHYYSSTWDMMSMATQYDSYDRKGPKIFVGEWAAQDVPEPWSNAGQKGPTPNMNCAIADAAFMTGLERNSDIVEMNCYAPLLVNVNPGARQWAVNLIGYDAQSCFGSPSYYAQKMFASNVGTRTVPLSITGGGIQQQGDKTLPGLFASATRDGGALYVKVVNALANPQGVNLELVGHSLASGTAIVLSGEPKAMNTIAEPRLVYPRSAAITVGEPFVMEPHSIAVLRLRLRS